MRPTLSQMLLRFLFMLALVLPAVARADDPGAHPGDVTARVAQLRELLASQRGAAILDLLGDPRVRAAVLADAGPPARRPRRQTAGDMMNSTLTDIRDRVWGIAAGLGQFDREMTRVSTGVRMLLPGYEPIRLFAFVVVFLLCGTAARKLLFHLARPWRAHFDNLKLDTPRERATAAGERLLFGALIIVAFTAGSAGAFLLFPWPPLTGSIILGYLLAGVAIRLSLTTTRFFFAPGAERLRLLPVSTETAWFWHRWSVALVAIAAIGWQTILMLHSFGMSELGFNVLLQLLLLVLAGLGIYVIWTLPMQSSRHSRMYRLLMSLALVTDWLLFLTGASQFGKSLLVLAAVPIALYMLGRSICMIVLCRWSEPDADDTSAHVAIARRTMQAVVLILAAAAMVHVWHIDMTRVTTMDTPMTRMGRGLLEALVILVLADLLWQVVRVLIDTRLAGDGTAVEPMDDDAQRRRARMRTLLPVLRNFAFFIVLVMASLSALAAMGLQIGPLLAGAGVVGIAVGFGAQTLVRDIISGVFFLLDDAFRVGEEIESGGIRGRVESFSLRSIKLRHLNGQLHTVPFGDLKAITNYSRDWVVERISLVVTYDTDLDIVDTIIDTLSEELMADPAMGPEMIEPLRSLGVQAMIDTGMRIGLVFKTRPGRQFALRRAVFGRIRAAFAAHGVRFAYAVAQPLGEAETATT